MAKQSEKKIFYHGCTIIRRFTRVTGISLNMTTGVEDRSKATTNIVEEPCGSPLFGDPTGVCNSCGKGWECGPGKPDDRGSNNLNVFANDAERERALASRNPK